MTWYSRIVAAWIVGGVFTGLAPPASAAVNLELRVEPTTATPVEIVDVGLYAVSNEGTKFTALEVLLSWDPEALELRGAVDPRSWLMSGFFSDEQLYGLNSDCGPNPNCEAYVGFCAPFTGRPYNDGHAWYQMLVAFTGQATATPEGLLVTTFRFAVRGKTVDTMIGMASRSDAFCECVPSRPCSRTQVLAAGNVNVTGELSGARVTIGSASVSASDVYMPAGREAKVLVSGAIDGAATIGVTILVELASEPENQGSVTFTPGPPNDIQEESDPWPGEGSFISFDTDYEGFSLTLNGSTADNGTFLAAPLVFSGPLASFPVVSSPDAAGVWDIRLCQEPCGLEDGSFWSGDPFALPTLRTHARLVIVVPGDGDGSGSVDIRDFNEFQRCFSEGAEGGDRIYSTDPKDRCVVYDFDGNGMIDNVDYAGFFSAMMGP